MTDYEKNEILFTRRATRDYSIGFQSSASTAGR